MLVNREVFARRQITESEHTIAILTQVFSLDNKWYVLCREAKIIFFVKLPEIIIFILKHWIINATWKQRHIQ